LLTPRWWSSLIDTVPEQPRETLDVRAQYARNVLTGSVTAGDFIGCSQNSDLTASYPHPMASTQCGVKLFHIRSEKSMKYQGKSRDLLDEKK
jgi:hypothetical protein